MGLQPREKERVFKTQLEKKLGYICVGTTYRAPPAKDPAGARLRTTKVQAQSLGISRRLTSGQQVRGRTTGPVTFSEENTARPWMYAPTRSNAKKKAELRGEG